MTSREIAEIEANDGSIARILGKRPVLWIGAGLSAAAGYPSTGAILDALIGAADDPIDRTRSFYEVVDAVVASVRAGRVRDVLQGLFQPARQPTPLHRALARLAKAGAFSAVVTTNYDDLVERTLAAEGAPYVLQPLEDNATVTGDGVRLLKIHGSYDDWANVVLSGRSYQQFGAHNPFLIKQLDVLLRQQPILFVGCSLQDPRILDWLAGLTAAELEGLKEWRAVMTGGAWRTAQAHHHRGAAAKDLFVAAGMRPLVVSDHDQVRAIFVDAAARIATPAQVIALDLEVTPMSLSAKMAGAPTWTPPDLAADAAFMRALQLLRVWDHRPLPIAADGSMGGPAAAAAAQMHQLAVQIGQRLSGEFLSSAALQQLRLAIGAGQAAVPPMLHVRVHTTGDAVAQHRGDLLLALPWEFIVVEGQFPVERAKLDVAREVVKDGAPGLGPPDRPLSVVAAVSAPRDASRLDYESECYQLWAAMGAEEQRLHITDDGQLETLARAMSELQPQVLHFTGHGEPNALLFEDEEARAHRVPVRDLIDRLRLSGLPRLAFLASCHGATLPRTSVNQAGEARDKTMIESGEVGAEVATRVVGLAGTQGHDPAWSSAAELHRESVDQVVAWFGPVGDRQCTRAEKVFYAALVAGKSARQAVREARQASRKPLRAGPHGTDDIVYPLGWAQLAFYHRGADVPTALPASVAPAPARERERRSDRLGPTRHGVPGIERLRFGFIGRRSTRAQVLQRVSEGQRLLVISGLGGLGKTALAATMAPIIARRIAARPAGGTPTSPLIIALDGRAASRAADPISDLWDQVGRGIKEWKPGDAGWATRCDHLLAEAQKDGLGGPALASVIAWWAAQPAGTVVYLDDAESLMEPVAGAAELGRWRSRELEDLWDRLCALATPGGQIAVLASTRYVPQGLPGAAALPLPPLASIDLVHLLSWWPVLGQLSSEAKAWVVEKLQGHPRSVEWLEAILASALAARSAPGSTRDPALDRQAVAALFPPLVARIDEDLVLPRLFEILGPAVRALVQRLGVLSRPAPWEAVQALEDEPGTALRAQQAGLVGPFEGLGPEPFWGTLPMVLDRAGALTPGELQAAHLRLGRWFLERWARDPAASAGWAEPAAHHLLEAGEASAAWEPAQRIVLALRGAGRYREALAWVERVLNAGPSGAERGLALTFDSQLRMRTGDLSPRLELHLQEALALVSPGDRSFALDELGSFLRQSGRFAEAARTLAASVADATAAHGTEDHRDVAASLHALAGVLRAQGDLPAARELLERALRIEAKVLGTEDHLSVAASLHELAGVRQDQGDLPAARELLERALRITAKVLGTEDHPSVAASLHSLAGVLQAQGDLPAARELLERSLRIQAKVLGTEDHPSVAASLYQLAGVLRAQGDLPAARELLERILQIEARIYGTRDHWSLAVTEESLAGLLLQQGDERDLPRAAELLVHAYRTYQRQLGDDHPRTRALAGLLETLSKR